MNPSNRSLDAHAIRLIAVEALTDPRSVTKHLRGELVRPMTARRIAAALHRLGIAEPAGSAATPSETGDATAHDEPLHPVAR